MAFMAPSKTQISCLIENGWSLEDVATTTPKAVYTSKGRKEVMVGGKDVEFKQVDTFLQAKGILVTGKTWKQIEKPVYDEPIDGMY